MLHEGSEDRIRRRRVVSPEVVIDLILSLGGKVSGIFVEAQAAGDAISVHLWMELGCPDVGSHAVHVHWTGWATGQEHRILRKLQHGILVSAEAEEFLWQLGTKWIICRLFRQRDLGDSRFLGEVGAYLASQVVGEQARAVAGSDDGEALVFQSFLDKLHEAFRNCRLPYSVVWLGDGERAATNEHPVHVRKIAEFTVWPIQYAHIQFFCTEPGQGEEIVIFGIGDMTIFAEGKQYELHASNINRQLGLPKKRPSSYIPGRGPTAFSAALICAFARSVEIVADS